MRHRAKVVLLSREGYRVPEIGTLVGAHPANLRKWIRRFNERGCDGLKTVRSGGRKRRFSSRQRAQIVELAMKRPRDLGLRFSRWTLHKLAEQASARGLVDRISHECVRQILQDAECDYRGVGSGLEA
jgi:transposase